MTPPARSRAHLEASGEDELMAQVQTGSADAFERLYDRYGERAYRVARSVCRDDRRARDAVQEAFISIWRSRGTYHSQAGTVAAWVLTAVRNQAIDVDRRNGGQAASTTEECAEAQGLRSLLTQLPAPERDVIALAFYGQLTHTEIATQLGLPPETVKGRMRLGLHQLRERLQGGPTG